MSLQKSKLSVTLLLLLPRNFEPQNESTQQSGHIVGPQQLLVAELLLLLKYLTKCKCRMRSGCVKCLKALSLVLVESPGLWADFLNRGAFSELKKARDRLLKEVHTEINSAHHFRDLMAPLRLTSPNCQLRHSVPWRSDPRESAAGQHRAARSCTHRPWTVHAA